MINRPYYMQENLLQSERSLNSTGKRLREPHKRRSRLQLNSSKSSRLATLEMRPYSCLSIDPITQNEARKAKLPDFWLPSLTPDAPNLISLKDVKLQTMCRASDPAHTMLLVFNLDIPTPKLMSSISMKHLTPVAFTFDSSPAPSSSSDKKQSGSAKKMCPSCKKELSNSIRIFRKSIEGEGV
jgi:hypothetical protein